MGCFYIYKNILSSKSKSRVIFTRHEKCNLVHMPSQKLSHHNLIPFLHSWKKLQDWVQVCLMITSLYKGSSQTFLVGPSGTPTSVKEIIQVWKEGFKARKSLRMVEKGFSSSKIYLLTLENPQSLDIYSMDQQKFQKM